MKRILFLLSSFFIVQNALAWGSKGHMIVAQIGEDQLTYKAKQTVSQLLDGQSMADVANWADIVKNDPEWVHTKTWHFVDIPDNETYDNSEHAPEGDLVTAITSLVTTLKSTTASTEDKQTALKFIIHFVGDIHQPLHVGRPSDHGGNSIKVVFEGKATNLHSLWDSGMISTQGMDYVQYAKYLQNQYFLNLAWSLPEIPLDTIMKEDMAVRNQIYVFNAPITDSVVLDDTYMKRNLATVNTRLLMGGKRLSTLLNKIFK